MKFPHRTRPRWPTWLAWAVPAGIALLVFSYQIWYQIALNPARNTQLFWLEVAVFGLAGPVVAGLLLRELGRHTAASQLAASQITALQAQETYLASVIASSADAIIGLDPEDRIITWNAGAEAMFGYAAEEILGQQPTALLQPGAVGESAWAAVRGRVAEAGVLRNYEILARTRAGRDLPVEVTHTLVRDAGHRPLGSAAILRDISQRKALADEEVRRTRELTTLYAVSAAMNQAPGIEEALTHALDQILQVLNLEGGRIYLTDESTRQLSLITAQGNLALLNPAETTIRPGECLCGLAVDSGEALQALDPATDPRIVRAACRRHSNYTCAAAPLLTKERMLGVLHVVSRRATAFGDGEMALLRAAGAQIGVAVENMRLREEARRAEALSTLIQEMHHRIKNNLQTVADLLSLEMSSSRSPEAHRSLSDSISRIKSIAAVHQLLSLEQLRLIDITELARQVCDLSLRNLVHPDQHVAATIAGPPIYLPSKQATALALVMNELIANALEHAFHDSQLGQLAISLSQEDALVSVAITDNGHGLPAGFDLADSRGLGLQIVRTLVEKDLGGTLRLENRPEGGCQATLTFYK